MTQRGIRNPGREQITAAITAALDAYPNRTELARQLGVSRKQTYQWENGNNVPSLELLASLAALTETPIVLTFGPETNGTPAPDYPGRVDVDAIADAVSTRLEDRLQRLEDALAVRVAAETSQLVMRQVRRIEQGADDPDRSEDPPSAASPNG